MAAVFVKYLDPLRLDLCGEAGGIVTKTVSALIVFLLLSTTSFGADPEPYLKSASMPFYPSLARQARIEGTVTLRFVVNEQGDTSEVEAVTGHQLLRQAAIESVQGWKLAWPQTCACRVKREAVFVYKISGELESPDRPSVTVKWFGKTSVIRVEIEGDAVLWQP
jgi:TonB family protein